MGDATFRFSEIISTQELAVSVLLTTLGQGINTYKAFSSCTSLIGLFCLFFSLPFAEKKKPHIHQCMHTYTQLSTAPILFVMKPLMKNPEEYTDSLLDTLPPTFWREQPILSLGFYAERMLKTLCSADPLRRAFHFFRQVSQGTAKREVAYLEHISSLEHLYWKMYLRVKKKKSKTTSQTPKTCLVSMFKKVPLIAREHEVT